MLKKLYSSVGIALSVSTMINVSLIPAYAMESENSEKENINLNNVNGIVIEEKKKGSSNQEDLSISEDKKHCRKIFQEAREFYKQRKYLDAFNCYNFVADRGYAEGQFQVAIMYYDGLGVDQDLRNAFQFSRLAADQGYVEAQYMLGEMYYVGDEEGPVFKDALTYYRLAAEKGHVKSQYKIGLMYLDGIGVEEDSKKALEYLKYAGDQGHIDAQCLLGNIYLDGDEVHPNKAMAFKYFMLAANQNSPVAQERIAHMYYHGKGVKKIDRIVAFKYYNLAANNGDLESQFIVGCMCLDGIYGVVKDLNLAFKYFMLAAEQEHVKAQDLMYEMCLNHSEISQDLKEAFEDLMLSPDKDANVQFKLGKMYANKAGEDKDLNMAFKYYKLTADKGYVNPQLIIATMYRLGEGVDKDLKEAFKYFKLAADKGNVDSQYAIGDMYQIGEGIDQNLVESFKCFLLAAEQGHVEAQEKMYLLWSSEHPINQDLKNDFENLMLSPDKDANVQYKMGVKCYNEAGVGEDLVGEKFNKAFKYWKLSAKQGHILAQYWVAAMYHDGTGTNQDMCKARKYIGNYIASELEISDGELPSFVEFFMLLLPDEMSAPECSNILWALGQIPSLERERAIVFLTRLKNCDATHFNEIVSSRLDCLSFLDTLDKVLLGKLPPRHRVSRG